MSNHTKPNYSYIFEDIGNPANPGLVHAVKHHADRHADVIVAVNDAQLLHRSLPNMPPHVADCVDVAFAVYAADLLSRHRRATRSHIYVELPVRHPEVWEAEDTRTALTKLLRRFTDEEWEFGFSKRSALPRLPELQYSLPFGEGEREVSLWSGGLDAYAGLYCRVLSEPTKEHVLFSTGGNYYMQSVQAKLATQVKKRGFDNIELVQMPLRLRQNRDGRFTGNSSPRARGFVFLMLGAICAYLQGQHTLYVYENGPGAINLEFVPPGVGRDHAVSVHPRSLQQVSNFLSLVLGAGFLVTNPFVLNTKAEMCAPLLGTQWAGLVAQTVTCDRRRRERVVQCGCCSSCLLRRQALLSAGFPPETHYGVLALSPLSPADSQRSSFSNLHLQAMLHQVSLMRESLQGRDPWAALVEKWPELGRIVEHSTLLPGALPISEVDILSLYRRYVKEWSDPMVIEELVRGLLVEPGATGSSKYQGVLSTTAVALQ